MHTTTTTTMPTGGVLTSGGQHPESWMIASVIGGGGSAIGFLQDLRVPTLLDTPATLALVLVLVIAAATVGAFGTTRSEDRAAGYRSAVHQRLCQVTGVPFPADVYDRLWPTGVCRVDVAGFGDFTLSSANGSGRQVVFTAPVIYGPRLQAHTEDAS